MQGRLARVSYPKAQALVYHRSPYTAGSQGTIRGCGGGLHFLCDAGVRPGHAPTQILRTEQANINGGYEGQ